MGMMINRRRAYGGKKRLLPSGYRQLEYIENTSNAYIDTGIVPSRDFGIEMDCYILTEISDSARSTKIFGSSKFNGGPWGGIMISTWPSTAGGQMSWCNAYGVSGGLNPKLKTYERITFKCINNVYTAQDGTITYINYRSDNHLYGTCYLFTIHTDYTALTSAGLRVYNTKIYEGYNVVRNFIPCKNPNNIVGMYDTVNGVFYSSPNGTAFVSGPRVS